MKNDLVGIYHQFDEQMREVEKAQDAAALKNEAIRHSERMRFFEDWIKPEAIQERKTMHEELAAISLENAKKMIEQMGFKERELLPVPDPLPKRMQGQSPSTIQAMLRHEKENK